MQEKTIAQSRACQEHIIMPMDVNSDYTLFGGRLMEWIDVVAGISARRHSGCHVRTAAIDRLTFLAPAHVGDVVTVEGHLIYTGRTSMIVCVRTYVESYHSEDERKEVNVAYLTMVAVDKDGKPTPVPGLRAENEQDQAELELGKTRRSMREA